MKWHIFDGGPSGLIQGKAFCGRPRSINASDERLVRSFYPNGTKYSCHPHYCDRCFAAFNKRLKGATK